MGWILGQICKDDMLQTIVFRIMWNTSKWSMTGFSSQIFQNNNCYPELNSITVFSLAVFCLSGAFHIPRLLLFSAPLLTLSKGMFHTCNRSRVGTTFYSKLWNPFRWWKTGKLERRRVFFYILPKSPFRKNMIVHSAITWWCTVLTTRLHAVFVHSMT